MIASFQGQRNQVLTTLIQILHIANHESFHDATETSDPSQYNMLCMRPYSEDHWVGLVSTPSKTPGLKSPQRHFSISKKTCFYPRASSSPQSRTKSSVVHSSQSTVCFKVSRSIGRSTFCTRGHFLKITSKANWEGGVHSAPQELGHLLLFTGGPTR